MQQNKPKSVEKDNKQVTKQVNAPKPGIPLSYHSAKVPELKFEYLT